MYVNMDVVRKTACSYVLASCHNTQESSPCPPRVAFARRYRTVLECWEQLPYPCRYAVPSRPNDLAALAADVLAVGIRYRAALQPPEPLLALVREVAAIVANHRALVQAQSTGEGRACGEGGRVSVIAASRLDAASDEAHTDQPAASAAPCEGARARALVCPAPVPAACTLTSARPQVLPPALLPLLAKVRLAALAALALRGGAEVETVREVRRMIDESPPYGVLEYLHFVLGLAAAGHGALAPLGEAWEVPVLVFATLPFLPQSARDTSQIPAALRLVCTLALRARVAVVWRTKGDHAAHAHGAPKDSELLDFRETEALALRRRWRVLSSPALRERVRRAARVARRTARRPVAVCIAAGTAAETSEAERWGALRALEGVAPLRGVQRVICPRKHSSTLRCSPSFLSLSFLFTHSFIYLHTFFHCCYWLSCCMNTSHSRPHLLRPELFVRLAATRDSAEGTAALNRLAGRTDAVARTALAELKATRDTLCTAKQAHGESACNGRSGSRGQACGVRGCE